MMMLSSIRLRVAAVVVLMLAARSSNAAEPPSSSSGVLAIQLPANVSAVRACLPYNVKIAAAASEDDNIGDGGVGGTKASILINNARRM